MAEGTDAKKKESDKVLLIAGRQADVERAEAEVKKLLVEASARKHTGDMSKLIVAEISLEAGLAGRIIGPSGTKIKRLQQQQAAYPSPRQ